jgi:hypothetical protein
VLHRPALGAGDHRHRTNAAGSFTFVVWRSCAPELHRSGTDAKAHGRKHHSRCTNVPVRSSSQRLRPPADRAHFSGGALLQAAARLAPRVQARIRSGHRSGDSRSLDRARDPGRGSPRARSARPSPTSTRPCGRHPGRCRPFGAAAPSRSGSGRSYPAALGTTDCAPPAGASGRPRALGNRARRRPSHWAPA